MHSNIPTTGFLRLPQVLALIPVGKSSWWAGCKDGRYPKPVVYLFQQVEIPQDSIRLRDHREAETDFMDL